LIGQVVDCLVFFFALLGRNAHAEICSLRCCRGEVVC
jgi:hypothetical protein